MHYNQIQYNTMQNNEIPWNKMMMMMTIGTKFEIERLNCHLRPILPISIDTPHQVATAQYCHDGHDFI